jgi:acyl-coenzyme A synthetase/AMP-(fatty) acid ligase
VVAFVVAGSPGLTAEALDRHCRESGALASFKRPRRVVFVEGIPKTASGKILRRLLRDGQFTEAPRNIEGRHGSAGASRACGGLGGPVARPPMGDK